MQKWLKYNISFCYGFFLISIVTSFCIIWCSIRGQKCTHTPIYLMSNEIPQNNTNCTFVDLTYVTLFQNSEVVLKKVLAKHFKIFRIFRHWSSMPNVFHSRCFTCTFQWSRRPWRFARKDHYWDKLRSNKLWVHHNCTSLK